MRSYEEAEELRHEAKRLWQEGCQKAEIARKLGITEDYARKIITFKDGDRVKSDKELLEEWSRVHKWYRRYKESERRRQQDARMSILIAWEDYSKGTRWL